VAGLDITLSKIVEKQLNGKAAVVDHIVDRHTKLIDLEGGAFYEMRSLHEIPKVAEI